MKSFNHPPIERKRAPVAIDTITADGSFSGYASVFGEVDLGKDRVERGAFRASIERRGSGGIRMLFQHDPAQPIGVWTTIEEDERGLFVTGRITPGSAKGGEVLSLLRAGAVDGLSIGYRTVRSRSDPKTGVRTILQADLWEISIVTFPMLPQARVSQVKNAAESAAARRLPSIREFERWLTRDAGLTRREAKTVIGSGFASLRRKRDAAGDSRESLAETIRRAALTFTSY